MRVNKNLIFIFSFFVILLLPASVTFGNTEADLWYDEPVKNNEALLIPGTSAYCDTNVTVENMGKEDAEIQIIMGPGDQNYDDIFPLKEKLAYARIPFGKDTGKSRQIDDSRIVNIGNETVRVHCK